MPKVLLKIERFFDFALSRWEREVKLLKGYDIWRSLEELMVSETSLLLSPTSLEELLERSSFSDFSDLGDELLESGLSSVEFLEYFCSI